MEDPNATEADERNAMREEIHRLRRTLVQMHKQHQKDLVRLHLNLALNQYKPIAPLSREVFNEIVRCHIEVELDKMGAHLVVDDDTLLLSYPEDATDRLPSFDALLKQVIQSTGLERKAYK